MPDHEITWDHTGCEHDEPWCYPTGTIACTATDCSARCQIDGECHVVLFLEDADDLVAEYEDDPPYANERANTYWTDGPVEVHWTGHGYRWSYPVAVPGA